MTDSVQLTVAEELLVLERGADELLLSSSTMLRPLYIRKGRDYIKEFLCAVSRLEQRGRIVKEFPQDVALLDSLAAHGIIVPRSHLGSAVPVPCTDACVGQKKMISLYLLISQSCNMGCVYCLNGRTSYRTEGNLRMSQEVAFKSVERCLSELKPDGYLEIVFFGGEPLLNWPLAKAVIRFCEEVLKKQHKGKRIHYHLTTNLSVLPDDLIDMAKAHRISFLCDVDGPEAIHNACRPFKDGSPSHEDIVQNIERLTTAGLSVGLRATVTSLNQDHLVEVAEHHKKIGGSSSAFVPVNPVNSDEDVLEDRLLPSVQTMMRGMTDVFESRIWTDTQLYPFNQYAPRICHEGKMIRGCGAPYGNTPVVGVNGDVYPCIYLVGIRRFFIGNIMTADYPRRTVLQGMCDVLHVDHMEDCRTCPWRYLCGGGCLVPRMTVLGNAKASDAAKAYCRDILCAYTKKMMELLLWRKGEESASRVLDSQAGRESARPLEPLSCRR
jgi:uncharacterized protein